MEHLMNVDLISREFVPLTCVIAIEGVTHDEWAGEATSAIERALIRVLARRPAARVAEKEVLDAFVAMHRRMFGSEWGARNNMNIEWRQLWERGRITEKDGALFLTAAFDEATASNAQHSCEQKPTT
jgi:hypothetical protein